MMPQRRPRLWRIARVRYRRLLRRFDRETPDWMRWLTPWGTSLALHALLLLLLAVIVYAGSAGRADRDGPTGLSSQLVDDLTALKDSDHAGDPFSKLSSTEPPSLSLTPDPESEVVNVPALPPKVRLGDRLQIEPPGAPKPKQKSEGKGSGQAGAGGAMASGAGAGEMVVPFTGRQGEAKAKLLLREGGTVESEKAVERGLDWLARHQRPDGSWSLDTSGECRGAGCPGRMAMASDTAATGLALLPMLGAGHTHLQKGRYQQSIGRGLRWLIKNQSKNGEIYLGGSFNAAFYSHAIASMALCEAYGITKDKWLQGPAQRAVNYIAQTQNKSDGGWRYYLGMPGDTSVFGWQLFALRSASLSGLNVPKATVRRCRTYLDLAATDRTLSTYSYQPGGDISPVMTAEALLGRQYLGWNRETPALLRGAAFVSADLEQSQERNIYYWYYATQMLHNMHGKLWDQWNRRVRETLVGTQVTGVGCDLGSWDPEYLASDKWTVKAGRLYLTSLSLLTLEVYYRYLPLYRENDGAIEGVENAVLAGEPAEADEPPAPEEKAPAKKAKARK
jgi:hypothetical protein